MCVGTFLIASVQNFCMFFVLHRINSYPGANENVTFAEFGITLDVSYTKTGDISCGLTSRNAKGLHILTCVNTLSVVEFTLCYYFLCYHSLRLTFEKRHLPVSDGRVHACFGGHLPPPKAWNVTERTMKETPPNATSVPEPCGDDGVQVVMIYDAKTNKLVPVTEIE